MCCASTPLEPTSRAPPSRAETGASPAGERSGSPAHEFSWTIRARSAAFEHQCRPIVGRHQNRVAREQPQLTPGGHGPSFSDTVPPAIVTVRVARSSAGPASWDASASFWPSDRQQAGAQVQQGGLARAVGIPHEGRSRLARPRGRHRPASGSPPAGRPRFAAEPLSRCGRTRRKQCQADDLQRRLHAAPLLDVRELGGGLLLDPLVPSAVEIPEAGIEVGLGELVVVAALLTLGMGPHGSLRLVGQGAVTEFEGFARAPKIVPTALSRPPTSRRRCTEALPDSHPLGPPAATSAVRSLSMCRRPRGRHAGAILRRRSGGRHRRVGAPPRPLPHQVVDASNDDNPARHLSDLVGESLAGGRLWAPRGRQRRPKGRRQIDGTARVRRRTALLTLR